MTQKRQTAIRISEFDEKLLAILSDKKGVSKTAIMIMALREYAESQGVIAQALGATGAGVTPGGRLI